MRMSDKMNKLHQLIDEARKLQELKDQYKDQLQTTTAELGRVLEHDIPELLFDLQLKKGELEDGTIYELKPQYLPSIREGMQNKAFAFLSQHGHGDAIKTEPRVLTNVLRHRLSELRKENIEIPSDIFNNFEKTVAKIKF